jgi:hypothetical protein
MTYIGVQCKTPTCQNVIVLQEISEPPEEADDNPDVEHPFVVKCDACTLSHSYSNHDLSLFEG